MPEFIKDMETLRDQARRKIEDGPVTEAYRGDKEKTISILNEALATEIVCVLRYMHHYFMATGVHGKSVADEFKEHADAEREHADEIAERIQQLGGKPDFNPKSLLERSASQYVEGETLADMIREDLIAERIVIEVYTDMIRYFGNNDPTTRKIVEEILEDEEEHAADLADLLYIVDPRTGETEGEDPGTHPLDLHSRQSGRPMRKEQDDQPERKQAVGKTQTKETTERGSAVPPATEPGTSGRTARTRPQQKDQAEPADLEEDLQSGRNRTVRLTKPNRKRRVA